MGNESDQDKTTPAEETPSEFRFSETSVSRPDRKLIVGQMISASPQAGIQLAATVTKISPEQIWIKLARPSPKHQIQKGEQVRIKYWDLDEAFYFESKVLKVFGSDNEQLAVSRPLKGVVIQRRKVYRVHESIPLSFTVIEAAETELIGEEVLDTNIKTLTVGGLGFETSLALRVGDKLDMNVQLPPSQLLNVVGSVIRCSPVEGGKSLSSVTAKFFQLDVEGQNKLLLFLAQSRPPDEGLDALWVS